MRREIGPAVFGMAVVALLVAVWLRADDVHKAVVSGDGVGKVILTTTFNDRDGKIRVVEHTKRPTDDDDSFETRHDEAVKRAVARYGRTP